MHALRTKSLLISVVGFLLSVNQSQAEPATMLPSADAHGGLATAGRLLVDLDARDATAATVNGVAFQNVLKGVGPFTHKQGATEYPCFQGAASAADSVSFHRVFEATEWGISRLPAVFGSGNAPFASLSPEYKTLLGGGVTTGAGTVTLTLGKLTKGQTYLVQLWVNDSRGNGPQDREQTLDGAAVMKYNVPRADGGLGQYVIGRFTATGPTQSIEIEGDGSGGAESVNAYQLRAIGALPPAPKGH